MQSAVDIIGDVHGHAEQLELLLGRLGYRSTRGAWRHADRLAVFVGDFIDRGPEQLRTLQLVRAMIDAGSAHAVMGNHELNAIGWATPDPESAGGFLRTRCGLAGEKNRRQHQAFLAAVGCDSLLHREWVEWFLGLPLWIETPTWRVVHACWSPQAVEDLSPCLREGSRLEPTMLGRVLDRRDPAGKALDVLLKGPEIALPPGFSFMDKDGHRRTEIRTRWWRPHLASYAEAYMGPPGASIPDLPLPPSATIPPVDRCTFIGHYWLTPGEAAVPLSSQIACVDYSVAKGGPLVAYRFDGEPELASDRFAWVGPIA